MTKKTKRTVQIRENKKNKKDISDVIPEPPVNYNPNRVRLSELETAIYRPKDNIPDEIPSEDILVFTISGKENGRVNLDGKIDKTGYPVLADIIDKDGQLINAEDLEQAYAKSIKRGRSIFYFVKRGADGKLYNPMGLYTENKHSKITRAGREMWTFSPVDKNTFIHYIKFLSTKNAAWLLTAQRELI